MKINNWIQRYAMLVIIMLVDLFIITKVYVHCYQRWVTENNALQLCLAGFGVVLIFIFLTHVYMHEKQTLKEVREYDAITLRGISLFTTCMAVVLFIGTLLIGFGLSDVKMLTWPLLDFILYLGVAAVLGVYVRLTCMFHFEV